MVRSAATPRVLNHEARWMLDNDSTQPENALAVRYWSSKVRPLVRPVQSDREHWKAAQTARPRLRRGVYAQPGRGRGARPANRGEDHFFGPRANCFCTPGQLVERTG